MNSERNALGNTNYEKLPVFTVEQLEQACAEIDRQEAEKRKNAEQESQTNPPVTPPIPQVPVNLSGISFLGGDLGKQVHEEIVKKYSSFPVITKVTYDETNKLIKGSNPFYVVAVNEILSPKGIRTATQADLERILKSNSLPLQNQYEDSSLVWRSNDNPNEYLAKDMFNQFKKKRISLKENSAYVIPLFGLSLRKDDNSPHGLSFVVGDKTIYFEAPILNEYSQQYFDSEDIDESTGIPKKVGNSGNRQLWTRSSGLSGLYLGRDLSLSSNCGNLDNSNSYGRVVVVGGEAANSKNSGGKR